MNGTHGASRRLVLRSLSLALLGAGSLAGCATHRGEPEAEPVPPSIDSLTLLPVAMPEGATVENRGMRGGLGMIFGPVGSLAASHSIRKNGERLDQLIQASGIDLSGRLGEFVMRELAQGPVTPGLFSDAQQAARARENDDFKRLGIESDALLDVTVNTYGFYCSAGIDDYTPQLYVSMGLRAPASGAWLGDASYAFDRSPSKGYERHFQTPVEHKFSSIDALFSDSARTVAALEQGMEKIAGAIATDVRTVLAGRFLA